MKSLQGSDIETYANQLFRSWKLGQAQKNNGVLLLVAPAEHKVRIEVGYGLEGTLTDALSSVIISSAIVPRFKANDYSGGIERGVDGIISVLNGDTTDWQPKVRCPRRRSGRQVSTSCSHHLSLSSSSTLSGLVRLDCRRGRLDGMRDAADRCLHPHAAARDWVRRTGAAAAGAFRRRRFFRRRRLVGRRRRVGEAGDAACAVRIMKRSRPLLARRSSIPADRSSACSHTPPPTTPMSRSCGRARWRCSSPWPLIHFTQWSVQQIFLVQLAVFIVAGIVFSLDAAADCCLCRVRCGARRRTAPPSSNSSCAGSPTPRIAAAPHLRVAGRALCADHCRRGHRAKVHTRRVAGRRSMP